ncbi:MAG TPA: carboxypeptidase-like regulatory domain-containing protein [Flavobacteriaceae bacterium]|nr:carboxypeptidase-like regulatory domain-containing protein [Flavobacteriaceae bacterium]MCB9213459.1 carboxypeptidase-like regulatory domain-containing protein [Alteromonas sp.]HPF12238.1 carboxypeptidase-like regulatory domain-containing protein [Flavobacteriaceae bacterium]HQU22477.1 carboxypeptidase-like regulatory domain-containing protein [Flavobacteriaceae bacterium]HQU65874.1 carboxypeptidase-like regulatory domain-containing protein [Flavobacteriaceae bacterium]
MKATRTTTQTNAFKLTLVLFIGFYLSTGNIQAQDQSTERTVSGVVNTFDGPLFGASVVLKGTTIGVATNEQGAYVFPKKLKEKDVLVISYLGYDDVEVTIGKKTDYVQTYMEDNPVMVFGALRMGTSSTLQPEQ